MTIDRERAACVLPAPVRSVVDRKETPVASSEIYEDHGVRFEYPSDWVVEVTDEDEVTTRRPSASRGHCLRARANR